MKYYLKFNANGLYTHGERRCNIACSANGKTFEATIGFIASQHAVDAADESAAVIALGLTTYVEPLKAMKPISKYELTQKLIALGKSSSYAAILGGLSVEEKLVWDSANNIEPTNPLLVGKKTQILAALSMTSVEFDNLFR